MYAVVLATERFRELLEAVRSSRGVPDAPCVILPPTEETEYGGPEAMEGAAERVLTALRALVAEAGP